MTNRATPKDKDRHIAGLQARIAELEEALRAAHMDPQFAILTWAGIDARWHQRPGHADTVVFFDLDQVHCHNAHWGNAETDSRIATVMAQVGDNCIFRWFSGDEFGLVCTASDALGFATRVQELLRAQGLTGTFGIARIVDNDLKASMAAALVQAAQAVALRGTINSTL
jgi:hypothetical protein